MNDAVARLRLGETRPIYGQLEAPSGSTLTISAQPTYTLYDSSGVAVTGHVAQNVTGYDAGAQAAPRAWLNLNTALPALAAGYYTMVFSVAATGSDGIPRAFRVTVGVHVTEPVA